MKLNGMFLELENEERGCGSVEEGGAYAGGAFGSGGKRKAVVWWLGEMWFDPDSDSNRMIWCSLPARCQIEVNPRETAYRGEVWEYDWGNGYTGDPEKGKASLGRFGLADHVGKNNYTPWSFAMECQKLGPNRRIQPAMAEKWAKDAPFAILFSHSRIPVFHDQQHAEDFLNWAAWNGLTDSDKTICPNCGTITCNDGDPCKCGQDPKMLDWYWGDWSPTWEREGFGTTTYDPYHGGDHPGLHVLAALDKYESMSKAEREALSGWDRVAPEEQQEAIFMSSWINVIHVVSNKDDHRTDQQVDAGVMQSVVV